MSNNNRRAVSVTATSVISYYSETNHIADKQNPKNDYSSEGCKAAGSVSTPTSLSLSGSGVEKFKVSNHLLAVLLVNPKGQGLHVKTCGARGRANVVHVGQVVRLTPQPWTMLRSEDAHLGFPRPHINTTRIVWCSRCYILTM